MGWLAKLFGSNPATKHQQLFLDGPGRFAIDVVGEASYQQALARICGGRREESAELNVEACLHHENTNPYDPLAIRVEIGNQPVGYLSRENARLYRRELERAGHGGRVAYCAAVIRGGWDRGRGDRGHFGVKLDLPFQ